MKHRYVIFIVLTTLLLSACLTKKIWDIGSNKQKAIRQYIKSTTPLPNDTADYEPFLGISRVEQVNDIVNVYAHLVDEKGNFLTDAANGRNNRKWCRLIVNGDTIKQYSISEVRDTSTTPVAYSLVLDYSGSMSAYTKRMEEAVEKFILAKRPQDVISIVKYDDKAKTTIASTKDLVALGRPKWEGNIGFGGTTAIINGIDEGINTLQNLPNRRKVLICFTDGGDNASTITKEYVTWRANDLNINLCTIDFNNSAYNNYMRSLAEATGGTYNYFKNVTDFEAVLSDIHFRLNNAYKISYMRRSQGEQSITLVYCAPYEQLVATAGVNYTKPQTAPVASAPPRNSIHTSGDAPVFYAPTNRPNQSPYFTPSRSTSTTGTTTKPTNTRGNTTTTTKPTTTQPSRGGTNTQKGSDDNYKPATTNPRELKETPPTNNTTPR